jgi:hypothetical protein
MALKVKTVKLMNWIDRRIQASARFTPSLLRLIRLGVILACVFIAIAFISIAGGLSFAALVLHQIQLAYAALGALALMCVLVVLVLRFRHKAGETLSAITDLASLAEFALESLFEGLEEVAIGIGVVILILGAAAALTSHLLGHGWVSPVSLALIGMGKLELVLGGAAALLIKRLFEKRLKHKAKLAVQWARTYSSTA